MTPEQREELKHAAHAATPGPWAKSNYGVIARSESNALPDRYHVCQMEGHDYPRMGENAAYIAAASPAAILSLIAQVEALTVPKGWKMVPVEPTPEMVAAAAQYDVFDTVRPVITRMVKCIYADMLDAAATIPAIPGTKEDAKPQAANNSQEQQ